MLPRPFPFPFFWGTGRNLPRWYREQTRLPRFPWPPWSTGSSFPPGLGTPQAIVGSSRFPLPPGGVFYPRSWPCDLHRLSPSLLASGTGPASPGLQSSFSIPIPGPATRTDSTLPRWHREQAFLPGRVLPLALWGGCLSPAPLAGWAPRALSPATQKSPGTSPQGICFVSFRSAPSGTAALPAGAWAAPPPGSRNRLPPRRSTR